MTEQHPTVRHLDGQPSLADELGEDQEEFAEWYFGDYEDEGVVTVLACSTWDVTTESGSSSPGGGESGTSYLVVDDGAYATVVDSDGERDVTPLRATSDDEAVATFIQGCAANEAVVVYRARGALA